MNKETLTLLTQSVTNQCECEDCLDNDKACSFDCNFWDEDCCAGCREFQEEKRDIEFAYRCSAGCI